MTEAWLCREGTPNSARDWQSGVEEGSHRGGHAWPESSGINSTSIGRLESGRHGAFFSQWAEHKQRVCSISKYEHLGNYKRVVMAEILMMLSSRSFSWKCLQEPDLGTLLFIPSNLVSVFPLNRPRVKDLGASDL